MRPIEESGVVVPSTVSQPQISQEEKARIETMIYESMRESGMLYPKRQYYYVAPTAEEIIGAVPKDTKISTVTVSPKGTTITYEPLPQKPLTPSQVWLESATPQEIAANVLSLGLIKIPQRLTPQQQIQAQQERLAQTEMVAGVAMIGATVVSFAYPLGKALYYKVASRLPEIPESWKLTFEETVKEPVSFYGEYVRFTTKASLYKIPYIGYRIGGERFPKLVGTQELEETFQVGEKFGKRGILEVKTEDVWLSPSEARLVEAEALLTRPTKIVGAGKEWSFVKMPTEGYQALTAGKQIEVEYSPSLLELIGTKGKRETFSLIGATEMPIEGQVSRFMYREVTGIQVFGKPLKGYKEVFGFPEVFKPRVEGGTAFQQILALPKESRSAIAQRLFTPWKVPLTRSEKATNQILREVGVALPTEKAFTPVFWREPTLKGVQLGQQAPQISLPILPSAKPTAQTGTIQLPKPKLLEVKPFIMPKILKRQREAQLELSEVLKYKPFITITPRQRERITPLTIVTPIQRITQRQIQRMHIPTPTMPILRTPPRILPPRFLEGGTGGGMAGLSKSQYARWFKRVHPIRNPQEVWRAFSGKRGVKRKR